MTFARRPSRAALDGPRARGLLAAVALLALLAPALGLLGDRALAGRLPTHGHLGPNLVAHAHPSDGAEAPERSTVFTLSDDGSVAASILLASPADVARALAAGGGLRVLAADDTTPRSAMVAVLVPPPRTLPLPL